MAGEKHRLRHPHGLEQVGGSILGASGKPGRSGSSLTARSPAARRRRRRPGERGPRSAGTDPPAGAPSCLRAPVRGSREGARPHRQPHVGGGHVGPEEGLDRRPVHGRPDQPLQDVACIGQCPDRAAAHVHARHHLPLALRRVGRQEIVELGVETRLPRHRHRLGVATLEHVAPQPIAPDEPPAASRIASRRRRRKARISASSSAVGSSLSPPAPAAGGATSGRRATPPSRDNRRQAPAEASAVPR